MKAETYNEAHYYTGVVKNRCTMCYKVTYESKEIAENAAARISERTPMKAYLGKLCKHWHVTKRR